jgi:steroid delta-isomerase-like uncharacterized protein
MAWLRTRRSALWLVLATVLSLAAAGAVQAQDATPPARTPEADACPPLTQAEAEAIVAAYWAPWNEHDVALFGELIAEDYVHHWGIGEDVTGRQAFLDSVDAFLTAFPDFSVSVEAVHLAGDTVIHRWSATGTQVEPFMGIEPTDVTASWTGINISRVECGAIVEGWGEADHFARLQQQGAIGGAATPTP